MTSGRGGARRDLRDRARTAADGALDRPVLDVVAPADSFETAHCRVQGLIFHSNRG